MSITEIRLALQQELSATPEHVDFKVQQAEPLDGAGVGGGAGARLWRVTLQPGYAYAEGEFAPQLLVDERFDGAAAWWGGPPKGQARVLAVIAEHDQIVLERASATPPGPDQLIRLYPPAFLPKLIEGWADDGWAAQAWAAHADLVRPQPVADAPLLDGAAFNWLRPAQRRALGLVRHGSGFLWGPPGTGKTTTLGVLLAELLQHAPEARVLLLSTTHVAVDQAVIALDQALAQKRREGLREQVKRLGARFSASAYAGREHLLPARDPALIGALARAEAARPPARRIAQDPAAYAAWSDRIEALRRELREQTRHTLREARLVAMTAMRATFTLDALRRLRADDDRDAVAAARPPFDWVVFDEASQVGLAQALLLAPLGRARLFAGDPMQLAPVLRSTWREAKVWLGRSPFAAQPSLGLPVGLPADARPAAAAAASASAAAPGSTLAGSSGLGPPVVCLDEQSRMAPPIGALVSGLSYDGALRVADAALADPAWLAQRRRAFAGVPAQVHVHVEPIATAGGWSAGWRGPVRLASADWIADRVAAALAAGEAQPDEVVVLTPFRAQRGLIRTRLAERGVTDVAVSTVHKAQGREAPIVVFDPVDGRLPFLQTEDTLRLLNVALSRAQAKVIVCLADSDLAAPALAQLARQLRLAGDARAAEPIATWARAPGWPANAVGRRVAIGRHVGEVLRVSPDGRELWLANAASGAEQVFDAGFLRRKALGEG